MSDIAYLQSKLGVYP
ncbi:hypothetical protein JCM5353_005697, partial [Sporobolomyces roseus]